MLNQLVRPIFAIGAIAIAAGLVACAGTAPAAGTGSAVRLVAIDMAFQPREMTVALNQPQTIRFENKGKLLHDWTVERIPVTGVKETGSASHGMDAHGGSPAGATSSGSMMDGGTMGGSGQNAGQSPLHVAAEPGHTAEIQFTATQAGTYVYYCTVAGHRAAGMEGRLLVG